MPSKADWKALFDAIGAFEAFLTEVFEFLPELVVAEDFFVDTEGLACDDFLEELEFEGFWVELEDLLAEDDFLDEPEAALSPQRQMTLLVEINRCIKQGAQFFIVTHSPILLSLPDAEILSFDNGNIHPCKYEETNSYQITSKFINNRNQMLKHLLAD